MEGYLGEVTVDVKETKYSTHTPQDWAMKWIELYGGIEGVHHKAWLVDQIVRILKGTQVIVKLAEWENGVKEERFELGKTPRDYDQWVENMCYGDEGPYTYDWDYGTPP